MLNPVWPPCDEPLVNLFVTTVISGAAACNFWPIAPDKIADKETIGSFGGSMPWALFLAIFVWSSWAIQCVFWSMNELIFCEIQ